MPSLASFYRRLKSRYNKPNKRKQIEYLQHQIDKLKNQMDYDREYTFRVEDDVVENKINIEKEIENISKRVLHREKNIKQIVRETTREYLTQLQNGK